MLDPLPEIGARMQNSLLGMDRDDFVESVMGARSLDTPHGTPYKPSSRTVCERARSTYGTDNKTTSAVPRGLIQSAKQEGDE
jgi:hypothetical protein